jgi:hypothetical protein
MPHGIRTAVKIGGWLNEEGCGRLAGRTSGGTRARLHTVTAAPDRPIPIVKDDRRMPPYRSRTTTHDRTMAGACILRRSTGVKDGDDVR